MERGPLQRPVGPRSPLRPSSPARPEPLRRPPRPPLEISTPRLNGRPAKGGLRLDVAGMQPLQYSQPGPDLAIDYSSPDITVLPPQMTTTPRNSSSGPLENVGDLIEELKLINTQTPPVEDDADDMPTEWSDEVIEELQRLGEGAGGAVHKVKDKRSGKILARKTITTRQAEPKQLLREVLIMTTTRHINIIRFYGAYISPSTSEFKILMEYGEGGSLESVSKRIRESGAVVGEKIAGRLTEGVLQGLAYLHSKKTIHRDIKPSNILLTNQGVVKLCDFGVSGELVESMALTFTGTSFYMAPERITGERYTIRSDVWSTGITILELVQNRFPFPNDLPPIDLVMYITKNEPPQLEDEQGVHWSDEMKDFVKQALTVNQQMRPTPEDMLSHPWIVLMMERKADMAEFIGKVYGWKRRSGVHSQLGPSSGRVGSSMSNRSD